MIVERPGYVLALATAAHVLVERAGGPFAASKATRVVPSMLTGYGQPDSKLVMPTDVALDLEKLPSVGGPVVTAVMADVLGFRLLPALPPIPGEIPALLSKVGQEAGDVFAAAATALADGHVSDREAVKLERELGELEHAAAMARAALRGRRGEG